MKTLTLLGGVCFLIEYRKKPNILAFSIKLKVTFCHHLI